MSGVELAGIGPDTISKELVRKLIVSVLAVFPLCISALEDYNEGLDPIKAFMRWERELPQFIRKLRNQHMHYEQTIRLLLIPITTEDELAEMLSGQYKGLWKEDEIDERLRDRLQESYAAYKGTVADIEGIFLKIARKLDLDRASEVTRNDLEAMLVANPQKAINKFDFKKRVKFGMSKKTIKTLLEELNDCNNELERFTDKSERLETFRKASKPSFAARLRRIQDYAKSLHRALERSFTCSCCTPHSANLQLEQRESLYAPKQKKLESSTAPSFTVSFSSASAPWMKWQRVEVHVQEADDKDSLVVKPSGLRPRKGVSFSTLSTVPSLPSYSDVSVGGALEEVCNICYTIQQAPKNASCIGLSLDNKSVLRGVIPIEAPVGNITTPQDVITLEELLAYPPTINGKLAKLSRKDVYRLAFTLASSALQLNSTPWFPDQWSDKNIMFHWISADRHAIDTEHPYITPLLALHDVTSNVASNTITPPQVFRNNKNTVLLALALTLLELYFGISADQYQAKRNHPPEDQANPWAMCAMVHNWTEDEKENLSAAFLSAITHCLHCFSNPSRSLQDTDFLQAAVEGIVLPLQEELLQFLGKSMP